MAKRIGPEVRIMNLFQTLSDDGRRIVGDWIKSQTPARPKASSTVQPAGKKSSRRSAGNSSTASTETGKEDVLDAPKCGVLNCGLAENASVHQRDSEDYHIFRTSLKKAQGATAWCLNT